MTQELASPAPIWVQESSPNDGTLDPSRSWNRLPLTPDSQISAVVEDSLTNGNGDAGQPVRVARPSVSFKMDPSGEQRPPPPRRSLSRSGTLNSMQVRARMFAAEQNNYKDFNHHNWVMSIRWIFKGSGVNVFIPLIMVVTFATLVVTAVQITHSTDSIDLGTDVTVGVGGCMALLLAFRLNVCYSRWWEGRLLWGQIINGARGLVSLALSLEADAEPRSEEARQWRACAEGLAGWSIAFAVALKSHLRETKFEVDPHLQRTIERLLKGKGMAFGSSAIQRLKNSGHAPLHAVRSIRHANRRLVGQQRKAGCEVTALENSLNTYSSDFHTALTGCERILRTPCPPGYVGVLRVSLLFFLMLLPLVLLEMCARPCAHLLPPHPPPPCGPRRGS